MCVYFGREDRTEPLVIQLNCWLCALYVCRGYGTGPTTWQPNPVPGGTTNVKYTRSMSSRWLALFLGRSPSSVSLCIVLPPKSDSIWRDSVSWRLIPTTAACLPLPYLLKRQICALHLVIRNKNLYTDVCQGSIYKMQIPSAHKTSAAITHLMRDSVWSVYMQMFDANLINTYWQSMNGDWKYKGIARWMWTLDSPQ